jgi:dUTP pyrophosphatase
MAKISANSKSAPAIAVERLRPGARLPKRMSPGASGFDLAACLEAPLCIEPGRWAVVPTGVALEIPRGLEGQVRPRSGLSARSGIGIPNAPGTIDSDYRGEVCVILMNWGTEPFTISNGDRIAQLVFAAVVPARLSWAKRLKTTRRGSGGFGHTGVGIRTRKDA